MNNSSAHPDMLKLRNVLFQTQMRERTRRCSNLMFDYFGKKFEGIQAQMSNKMEPAIKKHKRQ